MPYADLAKRRAHETEYNQRHHVKAKRTARFAVWRSSNRDRERLREAKRRLERRAQCLVANARTRARRRGIDPTHGYVPNNVRVVCQAMNLAMGDWGERPVWEMFSYWSRRKS